MSKTTVWAIALAAVLAMAAVPFSSIAAWADDDESEDRGKKKGKNMSEERRSGLQAGSGGSTTLKSIKLMAKGLAVEKTENSLKASDASITLTGTVTKGSGNQARMSVDGTVDIGDGTYPVRAQGKIDLKRADFGKLNIEGKISKDGSDQKFQLKALLLPTQDDKMWKVVTEKPAAAGRHYRIYAILGEMELDRSAPAPVPAVASVVVTPAMANVTAGGNVTFTAMATDVNGTTITGATFVWSLSNTAAGSLAPSASTTSAVFTGANVTATASSQVRATLTYGGATVTGSATVNVNPAP